MKRVTADELEASVPNGVPIIHDPATGAMRATFDGATRVTPPTIFEDLLDIAHERIQFRADGVPARGQEPWVRVLGLCERAGACWVYTGDTLSGGYGFARYNGSMRAAHRIVWQDLHGEQLTPDRFVCHACDNPPCCNPAHLWIGTVADNNRDRERKGRSANNLIPGLGAEARRAQTHCVREHEFTPENTYVTRAGHRRCRECERLRNRLQYAAGTRGVYVRGAGRKKPATQIAQYAAEVQR